MKNFERIPYLFVTVVLCRGLGVSVMSILSGAAQQGHALFVLAPRRAFIGIGGMRGLRKEIRVLALGLSDALNRA